jgi:hypothetical protein
MKSVLAKHPLLNEIGQSLRDILAGIGVAAILATVYHTWMGGRVEAGATQLVVLAIYIVFVIALKAYHLYPDACRRWARYAGYGLAALSVLAMLISVGMAWYVDRQPGHLQESNEWASLGLLIFGAWLIAGTIYYLLRPTTTQH